MPERSTPWTQTTERLRAEIGRALVRGGFGRDDDDATDLFEWHHCKPCWYRLPQDLRRPISDTFRRDPLAHLHAMGDARRWYLEHPAVSRG